MMVTGQKILLRVVRVKIASGLKGFKGCVRIDLWIRIDCLLLGIGSNVPAPFLPIEVNRILY